MPSRVEPMVVTVSDAASMLSIGRSRIYELIQSGALASVKIGTSRRVTIKSIRKLLADATAPPQRARRASSALKLGARRMFPSASVAKLVAGAR